MKRKGMRKPRFGVMAWILVLAFAVLPGCSSPGSGTGNGGNTNPPPQPEVPEDYIDTHMHLDGRVTQSRVTGNTPLTGNTDYDAAVSNLINMMDANDVKRSVIVTVPTHSGQSGENTYQDIRGAVNKRQDRLSYVAGGAILNPILQATDPGSVTDADKTVFRTRAQGLIDDGAIGFGEMLALHLCMSQTHSYQVALPDHPLYLVLADVAAQNNVPIDLHMEAVPNDTPMPVNLRSACSQNPATLVATIPGLETLLSHNRSAKIVWQHIGWDNTGYMTVDLLRRLLGAHSNLYLALRVEERLDQVGGGGPMPNRVVDANGNIKQEWLDLMTDFPERIMIGGDEFIAPAGQTNQFPKSFELTWAILSQLSSDLADKIGRDNAKTLYNLE